MQAQETTYEIRVSRINETPGTAKITRADVAIEYWHNKIAASSWYDGDKEMLVVLLLDTRHNVIAHNLVSLGSLNETVAQPREIFRPAIVGAAYALVVMHNHPSGDPQPSEADRRLTRRIAEAGTLLQMPLVDHVIVGKQRDPEKAPYFSFREAGLL
jgi:DNA repair protein RadC